MEHMGVLLYVKTYVNMMKSIMMEFILNHYLHWDVVDIKEQ